MTQSTGDRMLAALPPGSTVSLETGSGAYIHAPSSAVNHPTTAVEVTSAQVVAALLRVLRMLIDRVERAGRTEHVPALRRQMRLSLESVETAFNPHPKDFDRIDLMADDSTDPADHSGRRGSRTAPDQWRPQE